MSGCAKLVNPFRNGNQRRLDKDPLGPSLFRNARKFFLFSFLILPLLSMPVDAQPNAVSDVPIQLILPEEGCFNIGKRATIKCTIKKPFDPKKLVVLLNGEDLDGVDVKPDGFEYTQTNLLTPGSHVLSVIVTTSDGQELEQEFEFSTCPSKTVDETHSGQERKVSSAATPDSKGEGNPINESKPGKKEWESTFKTNPRLFNQNLPATSPGNRFNATAPPDRNLNTLGTFSFFSDKLQLKTLYTRAGELLASPETFNPAGNLLIPSFGASSFGVDRRGDMLGTVLTSELWGKKLVAEAEMNLSGFNGDTRRPYPSGLAPDVLSPFPSGLNSAFSPFLSRRDNTYRLKLRGELGNYNYEALYEYMSFDDPALGSQGITDTMQRYMFRVGGKFLQFHSLNLSVSQYTDNISGNNLSPRLTTTQAEIDYSFTKFESLPITLSYQRAMATTKDEPSGIPGTRVSMDTMMASMNYVKGPWNLGFQVGYSIQKDMTAVTAANNDTNTLILTFLPIYTLNHLSIAPGFSFGRSESHGVNTNTYTLSLDLRGDLFSPKLTYGLGTAYTRLTTSDNSSRQDILSANVNLFYSLPGKHWGFLNPSIGVMGLYSTTNDRILRQTRNDYEFFLMFQAKF